MTFLDNFKYHSKQFIFSDDKFLLKEREKTFNKIDLNKFDKKNNESLKNINFLDLTSFNYHFEPLKEKPTVKLIEKNFYQINNINGISYDYEDENIEIRNVLSEDFEKNRDNIKEVDDIILDLNTIFLNSGIFIKVKKDSKIKIKLIHKTDKNYTIFQHNFFNFQKNIIKINNNIIYFLIIIKCTFFKIFNKYVSNFNIFIFIIITFSINDIYLINIFVN